MMKLRNVKEMVMEECVHYRIELIHVLFTNYPAGILLAILILVKKILKNVLMSFEIIFCVSFSFIPVILLNHCAPRTLYSAGIFDGIGVPTYSGRTLRITTGKSKSSDTSVHLNMLHFSRIVRFELAHDFINRSSQFFFLRGFSFSYFSV